jgi:serine/threonine protein kinase
VPLKSGKRIGPYDVVALLGAGGMGEVYRARDPRLRRDVAIKVIAPHFASDPERLRRFAQETLAAGSQTTPKTVPGITARILPRKTISRGVGSENSSGCNSCGAQEENG